MKILSAPWVIPVTMPIIREGSVVVEGGRITALGSRSEILKNFLRVEEIQFPSVLMPGLINAHTHLELSYFKDIERPSTGPAFTRWIANLIHQRTNNTVTREQSLGALTFILKDQYRSGVALVADTGNELLPELADEAYDGVPEIFRMVEYLAPNHMAMLAAQEKIMNLPAHCPVTVHAPYSTVSGLFLYVKQRCRQFGHIFSVHTAESADEREFLRSGRGCFRDFLEERDSWDGSLDFTAKGFSGTLYYYDSLGILDDRTLLIHSVHLSEQEVELAAERGAHVCLCPGSNKFLNVGMAPVEKMLSSGLLPALGTDSPASNEAIDMWREMQLLSQDNPLLSSQVVLSMATLGGAQALHRQQDYGSLEPGRKSQILHIALPRLGHCTDAEQVVRQIVTGGRPPEIQWVTAS